jgi:hypothetical protein
MSGAAYPMTGLHPDTGRDIDDLVESLTQAADRSGDDDDRSRLRRAADALGGISREVLTVYSPPTSALAFRAEVYRAPTSRIRATPFIGVVRVSRTRQLLSGG